MDYGLRGADSDRDRRIVEVACRDARLDLHVERLRGRLAGRDFQARARDQRYGLARELAAARGHDVIVTAHNRDDQAETILYRLAKYASPRGLAGMRPRDGDLARPLLSLGAAEIRDYCRAAGIALRRGCHQRGADLRAQRPAPRGPAAARGAEPAPRRDARGGGASRRPPRRTCWPPSPPPPGSACSGSRTGDLVPSTSRRLFPSRRALRALVLHDLLREALGGEALVERRLVEALWRLAERADDAGS